MKAAPRYIHATLDDLTGWCGPVIYDDGSYRTEAAVLLSVVDGKASIVSALASGMCPIDHIFLDVANDSVRDRLIRRYALPSWHRDAPGGLSAEVSAGLVRGSALLVRAGLGPIRCLVRKLRPYSYETLAGVAGAVIGINARDEDVTARGCALSTPTGILLPPIGVGGEPVLWSIG